MAIDQQLSEQYTVPQLARIFHKFPHFNVSLHIVNNTFNPHSEIYLESLGILGSIPAALLILTLLVLLVYLVTRCCDRKPRHRRSIILLKYCLAVLALLCCGAIAVGLYGNDDVHNSIVQIIAATKNIDSSVTSIKNQTEIIELTLKRKVQNDLIVLNDQFDEPVSNKTVMDILMQTLNALKQNVSLAVNHTHDLKKPLNGISLIGSINLVERIEQLRWPITMAVLSALLILCVVLLVGVARHSRCALITFSVFGLFAVIISWLMASLYLTSSVALGDLCISPNEYISKISPSALTTEVFSYYTICESKRINPLMHQMREAKQATEHMRQSLELVKQLANYLFKDEKLQSRFSSFANDIGAVDKQFTSLASLNSFMDCKSLHKQYIHATKSLCHLGLFGLALMLLASVAAGFFFTVLVWVDSHTWIYIRKRNDYHQVNEQDPFLPPSAASQAIAARTLRGQGSYPPTAPPLNLNAHGNHTIKQPLLLTPPPPTYATATARARQMHESMSKGGVINGSGVGDHKSSQHNQQTSGRTDHRIGLGDQPGQYATLKREPPWTPCVASFTTGTLTQNSHGSIGGTRHLATFQDSRKTQTLDPKNLTNLKRGPTSAWNQIGNRPSPIANGNNASNSWEIESRSQANMNQFRSLMRNKAPGLRIQDQQHPTQQSLQNQVRTLDRNFSRTQSNGYDSVNHITNNTGSIVPNMYGTYNRRHDKHQKQHPHQHVSTLNQVQSSDPNLYAVTEL